MSKEIYYATTNKGKFESVREILRYQGNFQIVRADIRLTEIQSESLEEIAKSKVTQAFTQLKKPCIALDSGFYIDELNGWPGTLVGPNLKALGVKGFLKLVAEWPAPMAQFKNSLAYLDERLEEPLLFHSTVHGMISSPPTGVYDPKKHWSELVKIFEPGGATMTLASMDEAEYHHWKYVKDRNSYAHQFGRWIKSQRPELLLKEGKNE